MLTLLRIQNLALLRHAELELGPGLIAVTGESGAGKSTLLDALSLLSGQARPRVRPSPGQKSGLAEGVFRPTPHNQPLLAAILEELGIPLEDEVVLARRIETSGRTRSFVQGQMVPRATLARVSALFVEQCGQSEAHGLRTPSAQLDALDHFAGLESARAEYVAAYARLRALSGEFEELRRLELERERQRDFVEFQLAELSECEPSRHPAALAALESCRESAQLDDLCKEIQGELGEGHGMAGRLSWLAKKATALCCEQAEPLSTGLLELVEGLERLERLAAGVADHVEGRREEAASLEREVRAMQQLADKHRISVAELGEKESDLKEQLAELRRQQARMQTLGDDVALSEQQARKLAEALHERRLSAGAKLDQRLEKELATVGLSGARFKTELCRSNLGPHGMSHLEIGFSANRGSPLAPLARVASGGELSRILLCLRLAAQSRASILTFDEIDSGAGGGTAEQIGQALSRVASGAQVLCVTHWPQVAGMAHSHLAVTKSTSNGQTRSHVVALEGEERVGELARMLGGTSDTAATHARRLLTQLPDKVPARRRRAA